MQCASSTTSSDGFAAATASSTSGLLSCSGARKRNSTFPLRSASKAASCSRSLSELLACTAPVPSASPVRASRPATWSRCSEISGLTTTVGPSSSRAGTWYTALLPEPVGMTTRTSSPDSTACMASSCPGRSSSHPKASRAVRRISSASGDVVVRVRGRTGSWGAVSAPPPERERRAPPLPLRSRDRPSGDVSLRTPWHRGPRFLPTCPGSAARCPPLTRCASSPGTSTAAT